jgi:hypothetical protein
MLKLGIAIVVQSYSPTASSSVKELLVEPIQSFEFALLIGYGWVQRAI